MLVPDEAHINAVESTVTALLAEDLTAMKVLLDGLTSSEQQYLLAGSAILANIVVAAAAVGGVSPQEVWQQQMLHVSALRSKGGLYGGPLDEAG